MEMQPSRTLRRKLVFGLLLLSAAAGGFVEHRLVQQQQARLAAHAADLARLEATTREKREQLARVEAECVAVEREITAARVAAANAEARSAMKLWANRIALLRRLLEEMPAQALPELRLLTPTDWVHIVRNRELDTANNIRIALGSLRAVARRKMIEKLQESLKRFTDASGGELPATIEQLAPHLSAPADLEMLQRYAMVRTGRLGAPDETLIREMPTSDMISSGGLQNWHMLTNQAWNPPDDESEPAAAARNAGAMLAAFDGLDPDGTRQPERLHLEVFHEMLTRLAPLTEAAIDKSLGDELKAAAKRFSAERNGARPANMAELAPFMGKGVLTMAAARPILAELEYMQDHFGQRATDSAQLRRYVEKPIEEVKILRNLKLTFKGEHMSMNFSFNSEKP
jgi:hypothetical protein